MSTADFRRDDDLLVRTGTDVCGDCGAFVSDDAEDVCEECGSDV